MIETVKKTLEDLVAESTAANRVYQRNLLKEYFQVLVLDFIYSHPLYSQLVFYGGSCLFHCYQLPRLSEDLDFVDLKREVNISQMARDLQASLEKATGIKPLTGVQKWRLNLKFPVLHELQLAGQAESDHLLVKVEIFQDFKPCRNSTTETQPLFKWNRSVLIRTFDLPTLMATKIQAVLYRRWTKTDRQGRMVASVKGRDYFDLMWYLERGVKPNLTCFTEKETLTSLKNRLLEFVDRLNTASVRLDLEPLIEDSKFVNQLGKETKAILQRYLARW